MSPLFALLVIGAGGDLDEAAQALKEFRPAEALDFLVPLAAKGSQSHVDRVRTFELMGISYAYLEQAEAARDAFSMLLVLDPGHVIPYTLGPKVTFLFEEARRVADASPRMAIQLQWPRGLRVTDAVPVTVETVADPRRLLKQADLFSRRKGDPAFSVLHLTLPPLGAYTQLTLPTVTSSSNQSETVQLFLVAKDDDANETLTLGTAEAPFEVSLAYEAPEPWYGRWWVWAIAGAMVAAGSAATAYTVTRAPPDTVNGTFAIVPR